MDLESPETWRWIWLVAAFVFAVGEISLIGTFFLLPFGIGALAACITAFAGHTVLTSWIVFVVVSVLSFAVLFPLGRRLEKATTDANAGIGADRWKGRLAVVLEDIPGGPSNSGMARVDREEWRAASVDDRPIPAGSTVRVLEVDGTRVIVEPAEDLPAKHTPPE